MGFQLKTTLLKYQEFQWKQVLILTLNIENEFLSKSLFEIEVFSLQV